MTNRYKEQTHDNTIPCNVQSNHHGTIDKLNLQNLRQTIFHIIFLRRVSFSTDSVR